MRVISSALERGFLPAIYGVSIPSILRPGFAEASNGWICSIRHPPLTTSKDLGFAQAQDVVFSPARGEITAASASLQIADSVFCKGNGAPHPYLPRCGGESDFGTLAERREGQVPEIASGGIQRNTSRRQGTAIHSIAVSAFASGHSRTRPCFRALPSPVRDVRNLAPPPSPRAGLAPREARR